MEMQDIYYRLTNYNKKHNVDIEIEMINKNCDIDVTIYDEDYNNSSIIIYDFDTKEMRIKKMNKCLKLLSNKTKALAFIRE